MLYVLCLLSQLAIEVAMTEEGWEREREGLTCKRIDTDMDVFRWCAMGVGVTENRHHDCANQTLKFVHGATKSLHSSVQ